MISQAFLRTSFIIVLGNGVTALLGVAALRVYTELAPREVFGAANLTLGLLALGLQVLVQPVANMLLRFHTEAALEGRGDGFTGQILRWGLAGCGILIALAALGFAVLPDAGSPASRAVWVALAAAWLLASTFRLIFLSRLHAEQRMAVYIGMRIVEATLMMLVTAALVWLSPTAEAFVAGQAAALIGVVGIIALAAPWRTLGLVAGAAGHGPTLVDFRGKLRRYGAPFIPLSILSWLSNLADRYVLTAMLGAAFAGQYIAVFTIASNGFLIANAALTDLFRPRLFDAEIAGEHQRVRRIFLGWLGAYMAIGLAGVGAIALLGHWIAWLLLAADYREGAVAIMLWIGIGYFLYGLTQVLENRIFSLGHSVRLLSPVAVGAASSIVFSYVFIARNGIVGAAQGSCMSFVLQFAVTALILVRLLRGRR